MNFTLKGLQSVLFFKDFSFSYPLQVVNDLNSWSENIFNGNPIIPGLPEDSPPEIPRAVLNSADKKFSLSISLTRLDLIHKVPQNLSENIGDIKESYFALFEKIFRNLKEQYRVRIGRIACLATFTAFLPDDSNEYLYKKFLSENPFFGNTQSLEIHTLSRENLEDEFHINRWFRIKTPDRRPSAKDNIIIVEIDINTLAEEAEMKDFSVEEMQRFFQVASAYFHKYLDACFQEGSTYGRA